MMVQAESKKNNKNNNNETASQMISKLSAIFTEKCSISKKIDYAFD
jgi:hypothetical protein